MKIEFDKSYLLAATENSDSSAETDLLSNAKSSQSENHSETLNAEFVTKQEFKNFEGKVVTKENISAEIQNATSLFGVDSNYFLGGSLIVNLFLIIAVAICLSRSSELTKACNGLNQKISAQDSDIKNLEKIVSQLENELGRVKENAAKVVKPEQQNFTSQQNITAQQNISAFPQSQKISAPPPPRQITEEDKYKNFLQDFNSMKNQSGFAAKGALSDFVKKYNVQGFSCTNFEARMNEPVPAPIFGAVGVQSADFLAYEFEPGKFAVVPRVKTYSNNYHDSRAMGEIFNSNFVNGGTYNNIRVIKPAIFRGMWNLDKAGELELS